MARRVGDLDSLVAPSAGYQCVLGFECFTSVCVLGIVTNKSFSISTQREKEKSKEIAVAKEYKARRKNTAGRAKQQYH